VSEYFGGLAAEHTCHAAAAPFFPSCQTGRSTESCESGRSGTPTESFERRVFSHVLFHAQAVPRVGGGTEMSHLAAAFDALPAAQREAWSRLATVNAYSGAVHPLVHLHPRTGHRTLFVHLGQTGPREKREKKEREKGARA